MSDFITRLAQRQLGHLVAVEPNLPSRFAASAPIAPLPATQDVPTGRANAPRLTNLSPALDRVQSGGVALREEGSAAGAADSMIGHLPKQPREASPNAPQRAREAATHESAAALQDPEPLRVEFRPAIERLADHDVMGNFALPMASAAIAADRQRRESAKPPPQNHGEQGAAMPPLVPQQTTIVVSAPPRVELKSSPGRESAARGEVDAEAPIQVTIGRIEVTALTQTASAKRAAAPRKPALSLDDYLARRQRGER